MCISNKHYEEWKWKYLLHSYMGSLNLRHLFPLHLGAESVLFTLFQAIFFKVTIIRIHMLVYVAKPISAIFKISEKIQFFPWNLSFFLPSFLHPSSPISVSCSGESFLHFKYKLLQIYKNMKCKQPINNRTPSLFHFFKENNSWT